MTQQRSVEKEKRLQNKSSFSEDFKRRKAEQKQKKNKYELNLKSVRVEIDLKDENAEVKITETTRENIAEIKKEKETHRSSIMKFFDESDQNFYRIHLGETE